MAAQTIPSTMKAWQFSNAKGGLDKAMRLKDGVKVPTPKPDQLLVRVVCTALNPVDHKPAETPLGRFVLPNPATPGIDIVGRVVKSGTNSKAKVGDLVFGTGAQQFAGGGMAEYALIPDKIAVKVPDNVDAKQAAAVPIAGETAYQSIFPFVKAGQRVFVNGGSGGVGNFCIQFAKIAGCHVTTSCSAANIELCKSLGADEVLDYRAEPLVNQLKRQKPFDHIIDNAGANFDLYWKAHEYSNPGTKYIMVGASPSLSFFMFVVKVLLLPGFLGGGKRKLSPLFCKPTQDEMERIVNYMAEGKVKAMIDSTYSLEQGAEAMTKMKSQRAKGKIIVEVSPDKTA